MTKYTSKQVLEFGRRRNWQRLTAKSWQEFRIFADIDDSKNSGSLAGRFREDFVVLSRSTASDLKLVDGGASAEEVREAQSARDSDELLRSLQAEQDSLGFVRVFRGGSIFSDQALDRSQNWTIDSVSAVLSQHHDYCVVMTGGGMIHFSNILKASRKQYWSRPKLQNTGEPLLSHVLQKKVTRKITQNQG